MSLVAYASSEEESDAEEAAGEEEESSSSSPPPARGLFADLPPPKAPAVPPPHPPPGSGFPLLPPPPFLLGPPPGLRGFSPAPAASGEQPRPGGLLLPPPKNAAPAGPARSRSPPASASAAPPGAAGDLSLPKPKKRTEPVRITAPELHTGDVSMEQTGCAGGSRSPPGRSTFVRGILPPAQYPSRGFVCPETTSVCFLALSHRNAARTKALPVAVVVASMGRFVLAAGPDPKALCRIKLIEKPYL